MLKRKGQIVQSIAPGSNARLTNSQAVLAFNLLSDGLRQRQR